MQLEKVFDLEDLSRNTGSSDRYVQCSNYCSCNQMQFSIAVEVSFGIKSLPSDLFTPLCRHYKSSLRGPSSGIGPVVGMLCVAILKSHISVNHFSLKIKYSWLYL